MPTWTWGDGARVRANAPASMCPGSLVAICGVDAVETDDRARTLGTAVGDTAYLIEFPDGTSMEVSSRWLEAEEERMPDPSPPVSLLSLVHDSVLDSIRLADRSLTLVMRAVEGELVTLQITGVIDLVIDNLRLGNIVTYLNPVSSDDLDESLKRSLLQLPPGKGVALAWSGSNLAG
ncbi:hypothetical protein EON82_23270, partial [bacterium]